jgi:hypothetical protein
MIMNRTRYFAVALRALTAIALLFAGSFGIAAQEVDKWYSKGNNSQIFGSVRNDIDALAAVLVGAGLSDSIIAGRQAEAAGKKVALVQLLEALKLDVARSVAMSRILAERGLLPADAGKAGALAEQALIFFRAGLVENDLTAIIEESSIRLGAKAKPEAILARTMAVMSAVADMQAVYGLSAAERMELEKALASSSLSDSRLNSVSEKIAALIRKNSPISEAIDTVVSETRGQSGKPANAGNKPENPGKAGNAGNSNNAGKKGL